MARLVRAPRPTPKLSLAIEAFRDQRDRLMPLAHELALARLEDRGAEFPSATSELDALARGGVREYRVRSRSERVPAKVKAQERRRAGLCPPLRAVLADLSASLGSVRHALLACCRRVAGCTKRWSVFLKRGSVRLPAFAARKPTAVGGLSNV